MTQTELLLIILGGIFVIEALSVAIQVIFFKLTRRRVFLMAPVHHHFELLAWSETKIMLRFWIVAAVCAGIGYTLFQNSRGLALLRELALALHEAHHRLLHAACGRRGGRRGRRSRP